MSNGATIFSSDPKALLAAANSASEKVAALQIAFLALCAYVLVIVFSTTDMDLLIGKGVKLPVVDVEVPIVGFYATVPYLIVLVHFNLLLQLQLLSRKLYAFDESISQQEGTDGGLRDQLNIFPFNYYLVGGASQLVTFFVALLVTITILLLPLAVLLTVQARFLAYQSEAVTWAQRIAIWLDIGFVVVLWPVIMVRQDSWCTFMEQVWRCVTQRWLRWLPGIAAFAIAVLLVAGETEKFEYWLLIALVVTILLTIVGPSLPHVLGGITGLGHLGNLQTKPNVFGMAGLLATILVGLPLPLILQVDGETIDRPRSLAALRMDRLRHLDLQEKVLLGKSVQYQTIAGLRGADAARMEAAQGSIERINLQNRSLRRANLRFAILPLADLRYAQLEGANLSGTQLQGAVLRESLLQGADLSHAELQNAVFTSARLQTANLTGAQLQGALLYDAKLQGANLGEAQLQAANLSGARLQGANLSGAQLQGANLSDAKLQGADLSGAQLQGSSLNEAQLQGANLSGAQLQGADLSDAELQGASLTGASLYSLFPLPRADLIDLRGTEWKPISRKELQEFQKMQLLWRWNSPDAKDGFLRAIHKAATIKATPPKFESCLVDKKTRITCQVNYDLQTFREKLTVMLETLLCQSQSRYIVHGVLRRVKSEHSQQDPATAGLELRLYDLQTNDINNSSCPVMSSLSEADKSLLVELIGVKDMRDRKLLHVSPRDGQSPKRSH